MKKRNLFAIALAGLMLGSCSKDVVDNGNGASWNENGEGYISLAINLPTGSGSRANGDFSDGEGKEYAVKNAILMLFASDSESESGAVFNSAYNLNLGNWNIVGTESDQITSTARIVQKIGEITQSYIYALVVLNNNGIISVDGTDIKINGNKWSVEPQTQRTLQELNEAVAAVAVSEKGVWNTDGYFMSNSPLLNGEAPNGKSFTLATINKDCIEKTEQEALQNPAANIFVERVQAKIQVNNGVQESQNKFEITNSDGTTATYYYTLNNWEIDNYNTQTTLTRQFKDTWVGYSNRILESTNYRFVDKQEVKAGCGYRTYWGEDVNYANDDNDPILKTQQKDATPTVDNAFGNYDYCFENTSSSNQPDADELTRIIVKAQLGTQDGSYVDFFTVNDDRSTIYINGTGAASIQDRIKAFVLADQGVQDAIKAAAVGDFDGTKLNVKLTLGDSGVLTEQNAVTVTVAETSGIDDPTSINSAISTALYSDGKYNITINYYQGGVCYYDAYIRHFNDAEAPLEVNGNEALFTDANLLGRYGVLRNNWYVLNVKSIKGIGDSTVPVVPSEPVDKEELFLSVEINIMPWVKREQNVDL